MAANVKPDARSVTILVTGDVVVDHHIYIGEQRSATELDGAKRQTFEYVEFGGAAMIERLLRLPAGAAQPAWEVWFGLVKNQACYPHCFATWKPYPPDAKKDTPTFWLADGAGYGSRCTVYRDESAGSKAVGDPAAHSDSEGSAKCPPPTDAYPAQDPHAPAKVDILVVDDAGVGFRDRRASWPRCLDNRAGAPTWMVWKMAGNLRGGKFWDHVKAALDVESRLILVVSAADLQRAGLDVTVGLSWERSALDVLRGLETPGFEPLKACAHLVVSFPDAGALWINRLGEEELKPGAKPKTVVRLIYDPSGGEGVSIAPNRPKAFGYQACLSAGVVWSVASANAGKAPNLSDGLRRGLMARNKLFAEGHGDLKFNATPTGFPAEAIQKAALAPDPDPEHKPKFANTVIPEDPPENWTIAQQGMMAPGPFYDTAFTVARDGLKTLPSVPRLKVGAYETIERGEIEAIRRLRRRVDDYVGHSPQKCPLSIAVFGAPGAGKSFIVKQIARGFLGKEVPLIECNLSQLSDEEDLQGAFHLVRDAVLKGTVPVVFWDEFDSQEYRWLRLLLAPMQDGVFREGQIIHPIGKCIFIFAGGTSATFEEFGKPDPGAGAAEIARQDRVWRMSKGRDFKSRIHAHLDVLGPNPRGRKAPDGRLVPDRSDACFPIRRALFLRGNWKLGQGEKDREFDERLVRALLEVPEYTNGSRSFERVLSDLARGDSRIGPEALPPAEDLEREISTPEDSRQLVASAHASDQWGAVTAELQADLEKRIDEFAARINQAYMTHPAEVRNADVTFAYDNLSLFLRESNRAAVRRIPGVLRAAGLEVVKLGTLGAVTLEKARELLEKQIEEAAAKEHEGWCEFHRKRGWHPTESQADRKDAMSDPPRHPLLVPWKTIEKQEKREMDRVQARHYVDIVYDLYGHDHEHDQDQEKTPKFAVAPIPELPSK